MQGGSGGLPCLVMRGVSEGDGCVAPAADEPALNARSTLQGRGVWATPLAPTAVKKYAAPPHHFWGQPI